MNVRNLLEKVKVFSWLMVLLFVCYLLPQILGKLVNSRPEPYLDLIVFSFVTAFKVTIGGFVIYYFGKLFLRIIGIKL